VARPQAYRQQASWLAIGSGSGNSPARTRRIHATVACAAEPAGSCGRFLQTVVFCLEEDVAPPLMYMLDRRSTFRIGERLTLGAAQQKGVRADDAEHGAHAVDVVGMSRRRQEQ
jgi:hypothetical protein